MILVRAGQGRRTQEFIYVIIPLKRSLFEAIKTLEKLKYLRVGLVIAQKLALSLWRRHIDNFFELGVE